MEMIIGTDCVIYTKNGVPHREDGPAFISESEQRWYWNGVLHRVGGPAWTGVDPVLGFAVEYWYQNGYLHREDGPAAIVGNSCEYYTWGVFNNCMVPGRVYLCGIDYAPAANIKQVNDTLKKFNIDPASVTVKHRR